MYPVVFKRIAFISFFSLAARAYHQPEYIYDEPKPPKIAIIGGGIGGAATAYELEKLFGSSLPTIDVYESGEIGGRLRVVDVNGAKYEIGGSIIHPDNQHMVNFAKILGLEQMVKKDDTMALFKDDSEIFETSANSWVSSMQMIWRYGIFSLYNLRSLTNHFLSDFKRIYRWQNEHQCMTTIPNLLMSMSDELMNATHMTQREQLKLYGVADLLIDELVKVAARVNYGQTVDGLNGFVGSVSVAGATPGLWSVKGGNYQVPAGLLKKSGANIIRNSVTRILNLKGGDGNEVTQPLYRIETLNKHSAEYDVVVIASPFIKGQTNVDLVGFPAKFDNLHRKYHMLKAYLVDGTPNYKYFGFSDVQSMPNDIFPIGDNEFYNSLSRIYSTNGDKPIYKVFANSILSEEQLDKLFLSRSTTKVADWLAYPEFSTNMEFIPFVLAPRLYYSNAIELAASAMEMSAVGGVNVANLVYHQWMGNEHLIDNIFIIEEKHIKIEL